MCCFILSKKKRDFPVLLKMIFPDSKIVNKISLKCTKINYVSNYDLKEYFHEVCMNKVKKTACFTICFDESN